MLYIPGLERSLLFYNFITRYSLSLPLSAFLPINLLSSVIQSKCWKRITGRVFRQFYLTQLVDFSITPGPPLLPITSDNQDSFPLTQRGSNV